ncbi:MAG: hypothetical protein MO846_00840 [Candidatus Devosia symbiotica]|nr:hypothetical protein [Candidatus Devosia symbiotica]
MNRAFTKQVTHTCIFAHDLAATEAFYRDALGIPTAFTFMRGAKWIGYYLDLGGRTFIEMFSKASSTFEEINHINHICLKTREY